MQSKTGLESDLYVIMLIYKQCWFRAVDPANFWTSIFFLASLVGKVCYRWNAEFFSNVNPLYAQICFCMTFNLRNHISATLSLQAQMQMSQQPPQVLDSTLMLHPLNRAFFCLKTHKQVR